MANSDIITNNGVSRGNIAQRFAEDIPAVFMHWIDIAIGLYLSRGTKYCEFMETEGRLGVT